MPRRKCFISYHHEDEVEVTRFIETFDHARDSFIARGIGASMPGDVINSVDRDYIMRRVREAYLRDSTVTIVMIGRCTWVRRYVDWEIASTLRNDSRNRRGGLMGIVLPSVSSAPKAPPRLKDNLSSAGRVGYARMYQYPRRHSELTGMVESAFSSREDIIPDNGRLLFSYNRSCE